MHLRFHSRVCVFLDRYLHVAFSSGVVNIQTVRIILHYRTIKFYRIGKYTYQTDVD
jgi:hypothetical protein